MLKAKVVQVTVPLLLDLLKTIGAPDDARCIRLSYRHDADAFHITLESESFEAICEGGCIPVMTLNSIQQ